MTPAGHESSRVTTVALSVPEPLTVLALQWALGSLVRLYRRSQTAHTGESAYLAHHWPSWYRHNEVSSERPVLSSGRCLAVRLELEHRHYRNAEHFQFLAHVGLSHLSAQIRHEKHRRPVIGDGVCVKRQTLPFLD